MTKKKIDPAVALRQAAQDWAVQAKQPVITYDDRLTKQADQRLLQAAVRYALSRVDLETLAASAHLAWAKFMLQGGISSRKSEAGEETLVPYPDLSETEKQQPRTVVRAILEALK